MGCPNSGFWSFSRHSGFAPSPVLHRSRSDAPNNQAEGTDLIALAECLKRTVHLARAYASGAGSIFENAMTEADRLADRAIASHKEKSRG